MSNVLCVKCGREIFSGDVIDSHGNHAKCEDPSMINTPRSLRFDSQGRMAFWWQGWREEEELER